MKIPVPCPHGCGYKLEVDMGRDHQHIQCDGCGCQFCVQCVELVSINQEEQAMYQGMAKAHLN